MKKTKTTTALTPDSPIGNWFCQESGWWVSRVPAPMAVSLEADNRWHSYVTDADTYENSPSFPTMREAMEDAEHRAANQSDPN